jgi:hypothetical protein
MLVKMWWVVFAGVLTFVAVSPWIMPLGYDAYIHIFFSDHYRRSWFSLWDPRWYGGFSLSSYPPLVHQVQALISLLVGHENSYRLVISSGLLLLGGASYIFLRSFGASPTASAIWSAAWLIGPQMMLTAHLFAHVTTIFGSAFAILAAVHSNRYTTSGSPILLAKSIAFSTASALAHHLSAIFFLPTVLLALTLHTWLIKKNVRSTIRFALALLLPLTFAALALSPFLLFLLSSQEQAEILHWSRYPFDPEYSTVSVPFHLTSFLLLATSVFSVLFARQLVLTPFISAFFLLLGLGASTPIPYIVFGNWWRWLTYERFVLWSSFLSLPAITLYLNPSPKKTRRRQLAALVMLGILAVGGLYAVYLVYFGQTGPGYTSYSTPVNHKVESISDIAAFLNSKCPNGCGYLTLGLGIKAVMIGVKTESYTPDGFYPTARREPSLRASGAESIDSAYYWVRDRKSLTKMVEWAVSRGVKYIFVSPSYPGPSPAINGMELVDVLSSGVIVYESNSSVSIRPSWQEGPSNIQELFWGVSPAVTLISLLGFYMLELKTDKAYSADSIKPNESCKDDFKLSTENAGPNHRRS